MVIGVMGAMEEESFKYFTVSIRAYRRMHRRKNILYWVFKSEEDCPCFFEDG